MPSNPNPLVQNAQYLTTLDTDYVQVSVRGMVGNTQINPTSDTVNFAFLTDINAEPQMADWHSGVWLTSESPYYAGCLVGPQNGGVSLSAGEYTIWVQVIDSPTVPTRPVGTLVMQS